MRRNRPGRFRRPPADRRNGRAGRRLFRALLLITAIGVLGACGDDPVVQPPPAAPRPATFLALGDSYTVGQGIPADLAWPVQMADSLAARGRTLTRADQLAVTGWTTGALLQALADTSITAHLDSTPYALVTLMIGVNDQFTGRPVDEFGRDFGELVGLATALAGGDARRVIGFTIPNYGLTPVGQTYGAARIAAELAAFNDEIRRRLSAAGVTLIDITPLSEQVATEDGLVARDGLHYSAEMYRRWVALMMPPVLDRLHADGR